MHVKIDGLQCSLEFFKWELLPKKFLIAMAFFRPTFLSFENSLKITFNLLINSNITPSKVHLKIVSSKNKK